MSNDYRFGKPKTHKLTPEEIAKLKPYFPAKQRDPVTNEEIPWSEDSIPWLIECATRARDAEKERKQFERQQAEEYQRMEAVHKQQREERERERKEREEYIWDGSWDRDYTSGGLVRHLLIPMPYLLSRH